VDRVKSYRGTFAYEKALRKRRVWVEPLFGEAKDWHGLRRFRLRRLEKVNIEALLIASGQNMKRLVAAREQGPGKLAQAAALRPPDPVSLCRPHLTGQWPSLTGAKAYFNRLASKVEAIIKLRYSYWKNCRNKDSTPNHGVVQGLSVMVTITLWPSMR
jgi:hypothetical protein